MIPAVGLIPERKDVAEDRDGSDEGVESPVGHHAEIDAFRDLFFSSGGEEGEAHGGSGKVSEARNETDEGIEADAFIGSWDFDQIVKDVGDPL